MWQTGTRRGRDEVEGSGKGDDLCCCRTTVGSKSRWKNVLVRGAAIFFSFLLLFSPPIIHKPMLSLHPFLWTDFRLAREAG